MRYKIIYQKYIAAGEGFLLHRNYCDPFLSINLNNTANNHHLHDSEPASNKQNGKTCSKITSQGHIMSHLATWDDSFND